MITGMKASRSFRKLGRQLEGAMDGAVQSAKDSLGVSTPSKVLRNVGWVSAGFTALALGVFVGREIRQRYRFNRRTPYDFYAHSGDQVQDVEFGVGI